MCGLDTPTIHSTWIYQIWQYTVVPASESWRKTEDSGKQSQRRTAEVYTSERYLPATRQSFIV